VEQIASPRQFVAAAWNLSQARMCGADPGMR
jgi:hypothetical protein